MKFRFLSMLMHSESSTQRQRQKLKKKRRSSLRDDEKKGNLLITSGIQICVFVDVEVQVRRSLIKNHQEIYPISPHCPFTMIYFSKPNPLKMNKEKWELSDSAGSAVICYATRFK